MNRQTIDRSPRTAERRLVTAMLFFFVLYVGQCRAAQQNTGSAEHGGHAVEVQMRNVMYHFTDTIAVHILSLHGQLVPTKGDLPVFDDKESFTLQIASAEIA